MLTFEDFKRKQCGIPNLLTTGSKCKNSGQSSRGGFFPCSPCAPCAALAAYFLCMGLRIKKRENSWRDSFFPFRQYPNPFYLSALYDHENRRLLRESILLPDSIHFFTPRGKIYFNPDRPAAAR